MTSFVHSHFPTEHPGVTRGELALESASRLSAGISGSRSLAVLLLSAMASAMMVAAYEVMDTVAEGHLLVLWTGLWVAAFASLALFASTARRLAVSLKSALDTWSSAIAQGRADQRLWAIAQNDPRVMADLQMALARNADADDALVRTANLPSISAFGGVASGRYI